MQERRSTIRVPSSGRAQYRPSDDLLPRDGYLTDVSERGVGWLAQAPHPDGERITLHLSLPGDPEGITATGTVRWSRPRRWLSRWYPVGMEWLSLEEATRDRLQAVVDRCRRASTDRPSAVVRRRLVGRLVALGMLLGGIGLSTWLAERVRTLASEKAALQQTIQQRETVISGLQHRERRLQQEVSLVQAQFAATTSEVSRLSEQTQQLETEMGRFAQELRVVQQSAHTLRAEREALMQQVLSLEQERAEWRRKFSSVPELREAIREAVKARKRARHASVSVRVHDLSEPP